MIQTLVLIQTTLITFSPQVQGNNMKPQTFKNGSVSLSGNLLNMGLIDNWIGKNLKFRNFLKYYNY